MAEGKQSVAEAFRVKPGSTVDLSAVDPQAMPVGPRSKASAGGDLERFAAELDQLQEALYAEGVGGSQRRVLLVLQGMDTSGKGGVIRHAVGMINPFGPAHRVVQEADAGGATPPLPLANRAPSATARAKWSEYQHAYADALQQCGTERAPWYIIPSDRKWYRNWIVVRLLLETLRDLAPRFPEPEYDVEDERAPVLAADPLR
jgi:polyphosphate kinase 2 (PPK2 family)